MPFKFFTIPIRDPSAAEAELNRFLDNHKVLSIEKQWIERGSNSCWSFCIDYLPAQHDASPRSNRSRQTSERKDYKAILSASDFVQYARLRDLRKELASQHGVPVYAIFTNDQLAEMVRAQVSSKTAMSKIPGIGDGRIDKYGDAFLAQLVQAKINEPPTHGVTDEGDKDEADGKPV